MALAAAVPSKWQMGHNATNALTVGQSNVQRLTTCGVSGAPGNAVTKLTAMPYKQGVRHVFWGKGQKTMVTTLNGGM